MATQPAPRTDEEITLADDSLQPIIIRKLDRVETTEPSSFNGG